MKNVQKLMLIGLFLMPLVSHSQMSELEFKDISTVKVTGAYVKNQNIDTFRDSIKRALEIKYGHSLLADSLLKGGCQRQAEYGATGIKLPHGTYGKEGFFYSLNMTSHDPIETYPPSYVAQRLIGRMEDATASYYDILQLADPKTFWADLYKIKDHFYFVITIN